MRKRAIISYVLLCCTASAVVLADEARTGWDDALNTRIEGEWVESQHRAFDFWIGEWEMTWRSKTEGQFHFDDDGSLMRHRVFPILGGKALVELAWDAGASDDTPSGRGFSIRYYDEIRNRWVMAQNWPGPGNDGFAVLNQLIGFEDNGRLMMYSVVRRPKEDGSFDVYHRQYNFADIRDGAFRWDGSNSKDEGKSWETWNVVDAKRIRPLDDFGLAGTAWPGVHGDLLCPDAPHGAFDFLEGIWTGSVSRADGGEKTVRMSAGRLLDGCSMATVLEQDGGPRVFSTTGYVSRLGQWITFTMDDQPGTGHRYRWSPEAGPGAVFHEAPLLSISDEFTPFLMPELFDADAARRRSVWKTFGPDNLVLEEQSRTDASETWTVSATYTLHRVNGDGP